MNPVKVCTIWNDNKMKINMFKARRLNYIFKLNILFFRPMTLFMLKACYVLRAVTPEHRMNWNLTKSSLLSDVFTKKELSVVKMQDSVSESCQHKKRVGESLTFLMRSAAETKRLLLWPWWTAAPCQGGVSKTVSVQNGRGWPQSYLHLSV